MNIEELRVSLFACPKSYSSALVPLSEIVRMMRYDEILRERTFQYRETMVAMGKKTANKNIKERLVHAFSVAVTFKGLLQVVDPLISDDIRVDPCFFQTFFDGPFRIAVEELIHEVRSKSDAMPVPALNELPCGKEQQVAFRISPEPGCLIQFPVPAVGWAPMPFKSYMKIVYKLASNKPVYSDPFGQAFYLRPDNGRIVSGQVHTLF